MKRKIITIMTMLFVSSLSLGITAACKKDEGLPTEVDYTHESDLTSYGECDDFMSIDGKLTEDNWQNLKWFNNTFISNIGSNNTPSIAATTFFTKKGVYIASVITDVDMKYSGDMRPWNNTVIEFYYYVHDGGKEIPDNTFIDSINYYYSIIDIGGELYGKSKTVMRGVTYDGELNVGQGKTATFELFIEWKQFGLDVETDEDIPEVFYMLPNARMALGGAENNTILCAPRNDMGRIINYFSFGKNGLMNVGGSDSILGANKFGSTHSAGWSTDVGESDLDATLSRGVDGQWLYFKESYDDNFVVSADFAAKGCTVDGYSGMFAGFNIMSPSGAYRNVQFDYRSGNTVKTGNYLRLSSTSLIRDESYNRPWAVVELDSVEEAKNGLDKDFNNLKVIKRGTELFYFVNGEYYGRETISFLDGKVFVALMDWNTVLEVKNCEYEALTGDGVENLLSENGFYGVTIKSSKGGKVLINGNAVDTGTAYVAATENAKLRFVTDPGYKLSKVKIGETELTPEQLKQSVNGEYDLSISSDVTIEVTFVALGEEEQTQYSGKVYFEGKAVSANITLVRKEDKSLRYEFTSGTKGFDKQVLSGHYRAEIVYEDYYCELSDIDLTENKTDEVINVYRSTNMIYDLTEKSAHSQSYKSVSGVSEIFLDETAGFLKTADGSFMVSYKATASSACKFPCVGFSVSDGNGNSVQFYFGENRLQFGKSWSGICRNKPITLPSGVKINLVDGVKLTLAYQSGRDMFFMYANDTLIYKITRDEINEYIKQNTSNVSYKISDYFGEGAYAISAAAFQVEPNTTENLTEPLLNFSEFTATTDEAEIDAFVRDDICRGNHVDEDGNEVCDKCNAKRVIVSGTVTADGAADLDLTATVLKFITSEVEYSFENKVNPDGSFSLELWQGKYDVSASNGEIYSCRIEKVSAGENGLTDFSVTLKKNTFSPEQKSVTINDNSATIKGNGYAYLAGSGSAVYLKVKFNITNDHQGITIYTDSINGNNAQICFQHQGYTLFSGYAWKDSNVGKWSKNEYLGILTAEKGEHTVEYFIIEGKLYIVYDG
ncbi:MAG: hypothetical protein ACI4SH_09145, partial [Candidatus Scatosoma sp.]